MIADRNMCILSKKIKASLQSEILTHFFKLKALIYLTKHKQQSSSLGELSYKTVECALDAKKKQY